MQIDENQVLNITQDIWNETLALHVDAATDVAMPDVDNRLTGVIHIAGQWTGSVILEISKTFARRTASIIFACPENAPTAADMQDAVAEITNMLGGQIKSLLPGPSFLSLPSITHGQDYDIAMPHTHILTRTEMMCEHEPVRVVLLEEDPVAEGSRSLRSMNEERPKNQERIVS